jgi:lipid-binding SYLF domain-containing protein
MNRSALDALSTLYASTPGAKDLAAGAKGILVFPDIVKGGVMVGGQFGEGVLYKGGAEHGYYQSIAASYGLQVGLQRFGYALLFMTDSDLQYLNSSDGWEIGVGPTVTVLDEGFAKNISSTTARSGVYAFFFNQKGLMVGIGLQGTKISRISP